MAPQLMAEVCPPPVPQPEPGCHFDSFVPTGNGWTALAGGEEYPPQFVGCENDLLVRLAGSLHVAIPAVGEGWLGAKTLLRWRTHLPEGAEIQDARLRVAALSLGESDPAASLTADWYDWGGVCDEADYTTADAGDALSAAGECGTACLLSNLPPGRVIELALDNAAAHIAPDGDTWLRVSVDPAQSPETDIVAMADFSSPWTPPQLIVHWCEPAPAP